MRQLRAGNLKLHRLRAGRKQERIKFAMAAIGELDGLFQRIYSRDPRIQQ